MAAEEFQEFEGASEPRRKVLPEKVDVAGTIEKS